MDERGLLCDALAAVVKLAFEQQLTLVRRLLHLVNGKRSMMWLESRYEGHMEGDRPEKLLAVAVMWLELCGNCR